MVPKFSFHKELDQDFGHFDFPEHGQAPDRHGGCIPGHRVINGTGRQVGTFSIVANIRDFLDKVARVDRDAVRWIADHTWLVMMEIPLDNGSF